MLQTAKFQVQAHLLDLTWVSGVWASKIGQVFGHCKQNWSQISSHSTVTGVSFSSNRLATHFDRPFKLRGVVYFQHERLPNTWTTVGFIGNTPASQKMHGQACHLLKNAQIISIKQFEVWSLFKVKFVFPAMAPRTRQYHQNHFAMMIHDKLTNPFTPRNPSFWEKNYNDPRLPDSAQ